MRIASAAHCRTGAQALMDANLSTRSADRVVYHYDARCYICNRLQEDGLAFELNTLALNNPNVQFINFEPKYPQTPRDTYLNFATTFGSEPSQIQSWTGKATSPCN